MTVEVLPGTLEGNLIVPASKSAMQRACAGALVRKGCTVLYNPGISADDQAALLVIQALGARVELHTDHLEIHSQGIQPVSREIHVGESGLSVRLFTALAALSDQTITINGEGSLLKRPLDFFTTVLPQLGVAVHSQNGKLPLEVKGPLVPRDITIDGSQSSQYLTGLLFAYSALEADGVCITVNNLASKPYIDLTLALLDSMGLTVPEHENHEVFRFKKRQLPYPKQVYYTVESDWSSASFWLAAGAMHGDIKLEGLDVQSTQADKAMLEALKRAGSAFDMRNGNILTRCHALQPFEMDITDAPDLFPPLVAMASTIPGGTVLKGVKRLKHKESDRGLTLQEEFGKLGVRIDLEDDLMRIHGGGGIKGGTVSSRHDHRIAMALAIAALRAKAPVTITDAQAVNKSYPQFWEHLQSLGAEINTKE